MSANAVVLEAVESFVQFMNINAGTPATGVLVAQNLSTPS
ncbi:hypothetical protein DTO96_102319 [Ephemeroptericola cinctiostellae]|uniref:Uncharacterized protein n=1 Tax=Ephemeroptericola cinctiostellae TaxID=2268024 RepID=A0A345DDX6_9BURK|nr:hypothetical protein DTO96_102319 [Ephemeroptericola cinctiostellae]